MPPGGAFLFGQLVLGGGNGVDSDLGVEPQSAEGLIVGVPSKRVSKTLCLLGASRSYPRWS